VSGDRSVWAELTLSLSASLCHLKLGFSESHKYANAISADEAAFSLSPIILGTPPSVS
jgi:hypothetical protein